MAALATSGHISTSNFAQSKTNLALRLFLFIFIYCFISCC